MFKVTVCGGGTGTFVVLSGLKKYPLDLAVIVTMMDSGGSTGRLRDQLGVLPPGDVRQCLVALSEASDLWRKLFLYRFEAGDLKGHNFGNIFLSALEKVADDYNKVLSAASYILRCKGKVIPVTLQKTNLVAEYTNGLKLKGEGKIDTYKNTKTYIQKLYLEPKVKANKKAIERIKNSDYIILGPGDLYTSLIPNFLPGGIKEAFKKTKAKIIYLLNLMTKKGQTHNLKASDHLRIIQQYLGREIDLIIVNSGRIPKNILEWYSKYGEKVVEDDLEEKKVVRADLVFRKSFSQSKADMIQRSILRHSSEKVAKLLVEIFENDKA